jgi:hypothetical protein
MKLVTHIARRMIIRYDNILLEKLWNGVELIS